ncbi:initiator Replication family protein, partial [Acinetobacter baumannii 26016_7]
MPSPIIQYFQYEHLPEHLQQVSNLSSAYAVRLYELLIAWRSTGSTPVIELSDFRQRIGVLDTEYKRMERFKTSVLELAIKQINEHTDITVKYEQHKR